MQILQLYQANAITLQTLKVFTANVDLLAMIFGIY